MLSPQLDRVYQKSKCLGTPRAVPVGRNPGLYEVPKKVLTDKMWCLWTVTEH